MKKESNPARIDLSSTWWLAAVLALCFAIWNVFAVFLFQEFFSQDHEISGQLGDTFGVINSLFSALAFGGLFYTILLQRKELRETRNEFEKQSLIFRKEGFDQMLFKLYDIHLQHRGRLATPADLSSQFTRVLGEITFNLKRALETSATEGVAQAINRNFNAINFFINGEFPRFYDSFKILIEMMNKNQRLIDEDVELYRRLLLYFRFKDEIGVLLLRSLSTREDIELFYTAGLYTDTIVLTSVPAEYHYLFNPSLTNPLTPLFPTN